MIKTLLKKAGEKDFSEDEKMTTKRDLDKIVFLAKAFFVEKPFFINKKEKVIFQRVQKIQFFFYWHVFSKKKKTRNDERTFFDEKSNDRNSEIKFLEG